MNKNGRFKQWNGTGTVLGGSPEVDKHPVRRQAGTENKKRSEKDKKVNSCTRKTNPAPWARKENKGDMGGAAWQHLDDKRITITSSAKRKGGPGGNITKGALLGKIHKTHKRLTQTGNPSSPKKRRSGTKKDGDAE